MKKPSRKSLTKKLDKLLSLVVRKRGSCQRCGSSHYIQTAHVFGRKNRSVRWAKDNVFCLCAKCHFWAHENPVLFTEWVEQMLGERVYCMLKLTAGTPRKWTIEEMQGLAKELECLLP